MIFFQCPLRNTPSTNDSKGAALDLMGTSVCQPFTWFSPQQNNCHLKIKKKKKKVQRLSCPLSPLREGRYTSSLAYFA